MMRRRSMMVSYVLTAPSLDGIKKKISYEHTLCGCVLHNKNNETGVCFTPLYVLMQTPYDGETVMLAVGSLLPLPELEFLGVGSLLPLP